MIRVEGEWQCATGVLLTRTVKALNRAAIVGTADPLVAGAELELRDFRLRLDRIQGGEQGGDVDSVECGPGLRAGHGLLLWLVVHDDDADATK